MTRPRSDRWVSADLPLRFALDLHEDWRVEDEQLSFAVARVAITALSERIDPADDSRSYAERCAGAQAGEGISSRILLDPRGGHAWVETRAGAAGESSVAAHHAYAEAGWGYHIVRTAPGGSVGEIVMELECSLRLGRARPGRPRRLSYVLPGWFRAATGERLSRVTGERIRLAAADAEHEAVAFSVPVDADGGHPRAQVEQACRAWGAGAADGVELLHVAEGWAYAVVDSAGIATRVRRMVRLESAHVRPTPAPVDHEPGAWRRRPAPVSPLLAGREAFSGWIRVGDDDLGWLVALAFQAADGWGGPQRWHEVLENERMIEVGARAALARDPAVEPKAFALGVLLAEGVGDHVPDVVLDPAQADGDEIPVRVSGAAGLRWLDAVLERYADIGVAVSLIDDEA